jgi:hypothetical protein
LRSSALFFTKAKVAVAILIRLFLALLFISQLFGKNHCFFIPPPGWDLADPARLSPRVKVGFLGQSSKGLLPSVNLATEKVSISLKEYIAAVKTIHEADPSTKWRDLGAYKTPFGEGRLTEVETKIGCGIARRMQLIVIHENVAYILTVGALKEEFSKHYKTFEAVFRSLCITDDLVAAVPPQKQALLRQLIEEKASWETIISNFAEMGAYWQILFLQETLQK